MAEITVSCPFCGLKAQVPASRAGHKVRCRCGQAIQVPGGPPPAKPPSVPPKPQGHVTTLPPVPAPKPSPPAPRPKTEEAELDDDESRMRSRRRSGRNKDEPRDDDRDPEPRRATRYLVLEKAANNDAPGVISLVFGCLATACMLMGCFTCGGTYFAAVPFALIGGGIGFFGKGNLRVAGIVLNAVVLVPATVLLVMFVMAAGAASLPKPSAGQKEEPPQTQASASNRKDEPPRKPASEDGKWHDASKGPITKGSVRVRVDKVVIDRFTVKRFDEDTRGESKEKFLQIFVTVENLSRNKILKFTGWGKGTLFGTSPSLEDNFANAYHRAGSGFDIVGQVDGLVDVYPGKAVSDLLVFNLPVGGIEHLRLKLPCDNVDEKGDFRFEIPAAMIGATPKDHDAEWTDASQDAVRRGDLTIRVAKVVVSQVDLNLGVIGQEKKSEDEHLKIYVDLENLTENKIVHFAGWGRPEIQPRPQLRDDHENSYREINFGLFDHPYGQLVSETDINPKKIKSDVVIFVKPIKDIKYLRLTLPANKFGGEGDIRFQIPASMLGEPWSSNAAASQRQEQRNAANSPDPKVRAAAAAGLGESGAQAAEDVSLLVRALKDRHRDVRLAAATALGKIGPAAKAALLDLHRASKDDDGQVREAVQTALRQVGDFAQENTAELLAALADPDKRIQDVAALALVDLLNKEQRAKKDITVLKALHAALEHEQFPGRAKLLVFAHFGQGDERHASIALFTMASVMLRKDSLVLQKQALSIMESLYDRAPAPIPTASG